MKNADLLRKSLSLLILAIFIAWPAIAQKSDNDRYTLVLRQLPLEEALEELVSLTQINLLYDPELLTDANIYCNAREETAENILRCITRSAKIDFYRLSSGTYVLTELAQESPRLGDFAGVVVDKETGEPLPFANILLADASTGTAANDAGMFTFSSLLPGPHAIITTYLGYEVSVDSIWIPPDGQIRQRIELTPAPIMSDPIVVNGLQQRLPSEDLGVGNIDPANFQAAGNSGAIDVVYSLNSVMNVGIRAPFADLHIQGGESSENVLLLDGVPVFEPVSVGRMLGAFSPLAIGRLTVYKAGFGVGIGSQLSGVLSAEQHTSTNHNVTLHLDPLSANGRINLNIGPKESPRAQLMVAGRSSIWDLYQANVLDDLLQDWNDVDPLLSSTVLGSNTDALQFTPHKHGSDVQFSDIHAAGQVQFDPFRKASFSFYRGNNQMGTELLTSESEQAGGTDAIMLSRDRYEWHNTIAQLRYEWLIGARAFGSIRLRTSTHNLNHNYQMLDSQRASLPPGLDVPGIEKALGDSLDAGLSPDDRNRLRETALDLRFESSFNKAHHASAGLEIVHVSNRFSLDNPFFVPLSLRFSDWRIAGFLEDQIAIGLQTTLEIGSRFTYIPNRETVYAEPRIAMRYDVASSTIGSYSIHLATGLYRQFVNQFNLSNPGPSAAVPYLQLWLPIDESLAPPSAIHATANFLVIPESGWTIRLESYYKAQPRIVALHYHPLLISGVIENETVSEDDFIESTSGYALGGGVFIERTYSRGIAGIQYSYSEARRRFPGRFDNRRETTPWNEPHRLTLSHDFFFSPKFTSRIRMYGIWGRSWGFRQSYYDYLAAHADPGQYTPFDLNRPSSDRLPAYYQVDAGLAFKQDVAGTTVELRADAINLLNRRNVVDWSLIRTGAGNLDKVDRRLPGRALAFSLRVGF